MGGLPIGVSDITGIPVYLDLGVLRYVSQYAYDVPVHSTNSVNFRSIVYLLLFQCSHSRRIVRESRGNGKNHAYILRQ